VARFGRADFGAVGVGIDGDAVAAQVLGAVHGAVDALVEFVEVVVGLHRGDAHARRDVIDGRETGARDIPARSSMRWALELVSLTMVRVRSGFPAFSPSTWLQ
jgi:hypothetical protein